jgi:disease resistance protein RPM1
MQVLDLEGCKDLSFKQLTKICKMHQLKYLSLRQTDVKEIPSKIGRLESLEVLDIREMSIIKLPESVDKLQKMEHLLASNKNKRHALKLTEGITKMMALQTLSGVQICIGFSMELLRALQNLTNLKKFTIYKVGCTTDNYEVLLPAIEHLSSCSLKYLAIDDDFTGFLDTSLNASQAPPEHLHTLGLSGKLSQVPKWIVSLHNLEKLTLSLTSLTTDTLLVLAEAELPELFSLIFSLDSTKMDASVLKILHDNTLKSGGMIFVPSGGFTNLKLLCFAAPVLPPLSFLEGAMPGLQRIELRFRMVEGVYGLENLESLQQVHLTISSQAPEDARTKASHIKKLASKIHRKPSPSVVLDEYNESSEQK